MTRSPDWQTDDGAIRLYCGDCLDILPTLTGVNAVVTDPPYGVGFKYESHDDTPIGYEDWCGRWFALCKLVSDGPIAISCGISNLNSWPQADWVLCWHKPAAMGRCPVGFNNWEPVLIYGKTRAGQVVDVFRACITPDDSVSGHPCPKPLGWGECVVNRVSAAADVVCDPFMGSGTTGVAAVRLGRSFIGIERERKYFDIAVKRITEELSRLRLFEPPPVIVQREMFAEEVT